MTWLQPCFPRSAAYSGQSSAGGLLAQAARRSEATISRVLSAAHALGFAPAVTIIYLAARV